MIKAKHIPLIGMVGNMTECLCPHCRLYFYPFTNRGVDLKAFCKEQGIPYLVSVPLTSDKTLLKADYDILADAVVNLKPVDMGKKLQRPAGI